MCEGCECWTLGNKKVFECELWRRSNTNGRNIWNFFGSFFHVFFLYCFRLLARKELWQTKFIVNVSSPLLIHYSCIAVAEFDSVNDSLSGRMRLVSFWIHHYINEMSLWMAVVRSIVRFTGVVRDYQECLVSFGCALRRQWQWRRLIWRGIPESHGFKFVSRGICRQLR